MLYECGLMLCAVDVNWNDDGWNVNANSIKNPNEWTDGNHVFSCNCHVSPAYDAGVLLCNPFLHPPSMRPTSSSFFDSSAYLSVGISLFSHASCRKNFNVSRREIVFPNSGIF